MKSGSRRRSFSLRVFVACVAALTPLAAQAPTDAEVLFREGLEAMRAGNYGEACPKLDQSYRLDPVPGALFTLAECEAAAGKSATAIEHYQAFLNSLTSLPPQRRDQFEERRRLAVDKLTALSAVAPEITIDASPSAPPDLIVRRNSIIVEPEAYGVGKKVDPGTYVVSAERDGAVLWERSIKLSDRDRARIQVPWPPPGYETSPPPEPVAPAPKPKATNHLRTWMYVAGGVGAAGLTTGLIAGFVALGQKGTIDDNCPDRTCNAEGRDAVETGQSAALVSSVGFAVGLAGAGAAVALFVLSRQNEERGAASRLRPMLTASRHGGAIGLTGSFR